jgi:hypothetical protein
MEITPQQLLEVLEDGSFYDPKNPSFNYMSEKDWIESAQYLIGSFERFGFEITKDWNWKNKQGTKD